MSTIARGEVTVAILNDGAAGTDGRSITTVTPYYLVHPNNTGVTMTTHPLASWSTTLLNTTVTDKYLWRLEQFTWNLAPTTSLSSPYVIGQHSEDGATAWTTTVAPVSPGYTFTKTNLKGPTGFIPKVGDIIFYSYYRYTISTIASTTVLGIDRVTIRGATGAAGTVGRGISDVVNWYLATSASTGVTTATTGWTTAVQTPVKAARYLWNYEVLSYTTGTPATTTTTPTIIGNFADDGSQGDPGVSITGITHCYLATSASTGVTTATSGWTTAVQTPIAAKKYLWKYEIISYSNSNTTTTTPTIIGNYAADGSPGAGGAAGVSITGVVNWYLATTLNTDVTTATTGWTTTIQAPIAAKKYLWNYEVVSYSNSTTTTTTPVLIGNYSADGAPGEAGRGISGIQEYYNVNGSLTVPPSSWLTTPPATDNINKYLWNYEVISYTTGTPATTDTKKRIIGVYGQTAYEAAVAGGYTGTLAEFYEDIAYVEDLNITIADLSSGIQLIDSQILNILADASISPTEIAQLKMTAARIQWEASELYLKLSGQGTIATNLETAKDALLYLLNIAILSPDYTSIDFDELTTLFGNYELALIDAQLAVDQLLRDPETGLIKTISMDSGMIQVEARMASYLEQLILGSDSLTFKVMTPAGLQDVILLGKNNDGDYVLEFYNENVAVSWFKGQQMYISDGIIENTLKVGNHTIEKHSNSKYTIFRWTS